MILRVMDILVDCRGSGARPEDIAELLERIRWLVNPEESRELEDIRRIWMMSDDEFRVEVSLRMDEVFPASTRDHLYEKMCMVSSRFPQFEALCNDWVARWDEQFSAGAPREKK